MAERFPLLDNTTFSTKHGIEIAGNTFESIVDAVEWFDASLREAVKEHDSKDEPLVCTCLKECEADSFACKGKCGCNKCRVDYSDYLSNI